MYLQQTLSFIVVSLYSSLISSLVARQTSTLPLSVCRGVKFSTDVDTFPFADTYTGMMVIILLLLFFSFVRLFSVCFGHPSRGTVDGESDGNMEKIEMWRRFSHQISTIFPCLFWWYFGGRGHKLEIGLPKSIFGLNVYCIMRKTTHITHIT